MKRNPNFERKLRVIPDFLEDTNIRRNPSITRHTLSALLTIAMFFVVASQTAFAQYSEANAINNSGKIVGGACVDGCASFKAYLWQDGIFWTFGSFGGPGISAFGINDAGEIVGQSDTDEIEPGTDDAFISLAVFIDRAGVTHNLGTIPGYKNSQAFAINNAGLIIGRVYNGDPEDPIAPMRAMIYVNGVMRVIGTLGGTTSVAFALNNAGAVVGRARTSTGVQHAFLYENGVMKDLGTLGGNLSTARAINNGGQIVGGSRLATPGRTHAFLYENGVMRSLGTLGGAYSEAFGINERGDIVGASDTASGELHAFLFTGGRMIDLGTLGGGFSAAFGINNRGEIIGQSETPGGDIHSILYRDGVMIDLGGTAP